MLNFISMDRIVKLCKYKPGWTLSLYHDRDDRSRPYIQVEVDETAEAALCPFTGQRAAWKGGKRYMSYHMCRQEVVGAVFGAIKDAEAHEMHEWFKYKNRSIFNPHFDPDFLAEHAVMKNMNVRANAMSMEE